MGIVATKADVIAAGFCASGMREWCRLHGFSSADIRDGIPIEKLESIDCDLARRVVETAKTRSNAKKTV